MSKTHNFLVYPNILNYLKNMFLELFTLHVLKTLTISKDMVFEDIFIKFVSEVRQ